MSEWRSQVQMGRRVDRGDGRTLLLFCNDADGWMVGAIETSIAAAKDGEGMLDDHNHKVVGRYETIREALDAADSFAAAWLKNWKSTRSDKCDCEEMPVPALKVPRFGRASRRATKLRRA